MLSLLLVVLCSIAISVILKINESRGGDRLVVAGANYIVASALAAIFAVDLTPSGTELWFGAIVGGAFVAGFLLLMKGLNEIGVAIPTSAARLSMLVPVIGSIFFFGEQPTGFQIAGIAAGTLAFLLLGGAQRKEENQGVDTGAVLLLCAIFLVAGLADFSMKIAGEIGLETGRFIMVVFAAAGVYCWIAVVARGSRPTLHELLNGALLGIPNFFASWFLLRALEELPSGLVYPAVSAAGVVGATAVGLLFWKERPTTIAWIGIGLAAVAVALLGMSGG